MKIKKFKNIIILIVTNICIFHTNLANALCPYDPNCLNNPYGAGSPYKSDGIMNPYSKNGSRYSNDSWNNPYATNAPKIYDEQGGYHGRLSLSRTGFVTPS